MVAQHKLSDAEIRRKLKKELRRARKGAKDGRIWLEVFSGSGVMSCKLGSALKSDGISFELSEGAHFDVSRSVVVQLSNGWIKARLISCVWLAPPGATWSIARRPVIRTAECLAGTPEAAADATTGPLLRSGNSTMRAAEIIAQTCWRSRTPCVVENPETSLAWRRRAWCWLRLQAGVSRVIGDQCQYGAPWRKRTAFLTIHLSQQDAQRLGRRCTGHRGVCSRTGRAHVQVVGSKLSKLTSRYPVSLARAGATALAAAHENQMLHELVRFA